MTLRESLVLAAFALLIVFGTPSGSRLLAATTQTKAKPAKKHTAKPKAQPATPDATVQSSDEADIERITVEELKEKIARNEPLTIIDDRSEGSYEAAETQIKGSTRMTVDEIQSRIKEVPRDREIITYCT